MSPQAAHWPDTHIAWAVFDAVWYLKTFPEAAEACDNNPEAALNYYFQTGCRLGHSPSPLFDEAFYLKANPDIAALAEAGQYRSGFDHFCQYGHRALSPHLLFDDALYAASYEDMTLENLDRYNCFGRYDHYLKSGQRETRMAHFLFDAQFYRDRAIASGTAAEEIDQMGPFVHYLHQLEAGDTELPCSVYFEPGWYLETYPAVADEIAKGRYRSALHHYLCNDTPLAFDPVPEYSERFYLEAHPDIAESVEAGNFRTGYQHFVQYGAFELRRPRADIDLIYYRDMNPAVRDDINSGRVRDAFAHLRLIGMRDNLSYCPPERVPDINEMAAKQLFLLKARNALALYSRRKLDFTCGAPRLSVIMVLYNKFELTMLALASLRDNFAGEIELILVDNASTDDTARLATYVRGAVLIHSTENIGFLRACNLALDKVTAPVLLYLNNDVELGHGCIEAGLERINSDSKISAVGGKVIRTHGRLQEAGCIIWADGSTSGYLRDASPLTPEANFVRDVDFCSGVFLMCDTALVRSLGGFDEAFSPAYYEESDLCVRMIESGYRVVYDPAVTVQHLEYGSAPTTEASLALMRSGHRIFKRKHEAFLASKQPRNQDSVASSAIHARALNEAGRHILFLEDTVPVRRLGSGFTRANDVVRALAAAGYRVSVLPVNGARHDIMSLFGDLPDTVEVLHDRTIMTLPELLRERRGYYDLVWISRTHNLDRVLPIFRQAEIDPGNTPFILDTEAVEAVRDAEAASIAPKALFNFDRALRREFANAGACRHITAVNEAEAVLLRRIGLFPVSVLGTIREPQPGPRDFASRSGLLFVGSIHQADSPNLDGLRWYAGEILPLLAEFMAEQRRPVPKLTVIGYTAPDIDLEEFAGHPHIEVHGAVDDLTPVYDSHRVFIAPTRFAAGTPYKVYETASFGLPCIATNLLVRQLGWQEGEEILGALVQDAAGFARQIARLYQSETLWEKLRDGALRRLKRENGKAAFQASVSTIIGGALRRN